MLEQFSDSRLVAFIVIGPALCGNDPHLLTQPSFFLAGDGAEMFRIITEQANYRVITTSRGVQADTQWQGLTNHFYLSS